MKEHLHELEKMKSQFSAKKAKIEREEENVEI